MENNTNLKVNLLAYTPDARRIAFTAIRTCYSPNTPLEIFDGEELEQYDAKQATDGGIGTDADRLIRHIVNSGHTSTLEHINFTFAVSGASRSLLAQLTRHRVGVAFSVQSQRYVSDATGKKKGEFKYITPPKIAEDPITNVLFNELMEKIQLYYDLLISFKVSPEDARFVLPNAAVTNITLTFNLRELLHFYTVRSTKQAQWEIRALSEDLRAEVVAVEPWLEPFFNLVKAA